MSNSSPEATVAVVDDDPRILTSLGNLLQSAGFSVRLHASAAGLLESGDLASLDCLISDIDLPAMNGFELVKLAHVARPQLPVILITGHVDMATRVASERAAYERLLTKPLDGEALISAVIDSIRQAGPR